MLTLLSISSAVVIAIILAKAAFTTTAASTIITNANDSADSEIEFQLLPLIRVYRDGRVERLCGTDILPASFDTKTRVVSKDVVIDSSTGITARIYLPTSCAMEALTPNSKLPLLVYFHGGAFLVESPFSPTYHPHLNNLASLAPLIGVSINYSLAPEHRLPIAYQDSWTALLWVFSKVDPWIAELADFDRVYVAGDSAGANIAHQMVMRVGEEEGMMGGGIKGMALVHSYFWGEEPIAGERNDTKYRSDMEEIWRFLFSDTIEMDDPRINPVAETAPSLAGLGCDRVLVAVAEKDLMWSRGRLYYDKLKSSGWRGEAILVDTPDAEHDFHIFHPETEKALAMTETLAAFFGQGLVTTIK